MVLIAVVLPAPFGPSKPRTSPRCTDSERLATATYIISYCGSHQRWVRLLTTFSIYICIAIKLKLICKPWFFRPVSFACTYFRCRLWRIPCADFAWEPQADKKQERRVKSNIKVYKNSGTAFYLKSTIKTLNWVGRMVTWLSGSS